MNMLEISHLQNAPTLAAEKRARLIAHYLPQYHPVPENDQWWGKGFTEWTNVAKAKPLYRGHYQPHVPADLGFYDLRVPETRAAQAEMAREYGIEAFCYWHYWFAGGRLLERPFNEVLRSGEPDFPFCLAWANHTWSGVWYGAPNTILKEQTYPGLHDHEAHFYTLLEAFQDRRYLTVDGKPLLMIFAPKELPDSNRVTDFWRELAVRNGLKGLHIVAHVTDDRWNPHQHGFDAVTIPRFMQMIGQRLTNPLAGAARKVRRTRLYRSGSARPANVYPYSDAAEDFVIERDLGYEYYPCIVPNWDNTPRSGSNGSVLQASTPQLFQARVQQAIRRVQTLPEDHRIVTVKSWNEWAEGNHLEPDLKYGKAYLQAIKDEVFTLAERV